MQTISHIFLKILSDSIPTGSPILSAKGLWLPGGGLDVPCQYTFTASVEVADELNRRNITFEVIGIRNIQYKL